SQKLHLASLLAGLPRSTPASQTSERPGQRRQDPHLRPPSRLPLLILCDTRPSDVASRWRAELYLDLLQSRARSVRLVVQKAVLIRIRNPMPPDDANSCQPENQ